MRNSAFYQPAAALAAVLILPWMAFVTGGYNNPFMAKGQITIVSCKGTGLIKNLCAGSAPSNPQAISDFETAGINNWLDAHSLPHDNTVLTYGRADLRNELKAFLLASLVGIIQTPAAQRTANDQAVYDWLQANLQQLEIQYYTAAINEWNKFQNNPCGYTLDPDIAKQYNLTYNSAPFCYPQLYSGLSTPAVPEPNYFLAVGLKSAYGAALSAGSQTGTAGAWVIGNDIKYTAALPLGAGLGAGVVTSVSVAAAASQIFPSSVGLAARVAAGLDVLQASLSAASDAAPFVTGMSAAGAGAIVVAAVAIAIEAGIQAITNQQEIDQMNALSGTLQSIKSTPPDLSSYLNDQPSQFRLEAAFAIQTLPDTPSITTLPQPTAGSNIEFQITPQNGSAGPLTPQATYQDWNKNNISITPWSPSAANSTADGYFIFSKVNSDGSTTPFSLTPTINYLDWNGNQMTASRDEEEFLVVRNDSTLPTCPADALTKVSIQDPSQCSAFVTDTLQFVDSSGQNVSVRFAGTPIFTSASRFTNPINSQGTATITVSSVVPVTSFQVTSPAPLPSGISVSQLDANDLQVQYNSATAQSNTLTFAATNSYGTTTQNVLFTSYGNLQFTSIPNIVTANGVQVRYLVVTNEGSVATITGSNFDSYGLTLTDNNDGTATIAGKTQNFPLLGCAANPGGLNGVCPVVTATDGHTTITTQVSIQAPLPFFQVGSQTVVVTDAGPSYLAPGQPASASLFPNPVFDPDQNITQFSYTGLLPPGLSLSLVNGEILVTGTPAIGSDGDYFVNILANKGVGTWDFRTTIHVGIPLAPHFTSAPEVVLWLHQPSSFSVTATGNPVAQIQQTGGTVPPGITVPSGGGAGNVPLTGTPTAAGTYSIQWQASGIDPTTNQTATVSQTLTIYVQQAGDVNGDGVVDCKDYDVVRQSLGLRTGQTGFNSQADLNGDGLITIEDLSKEALQVSGNPVCH
jgi:Dockerin type I domain